jgi:hypothetical protein
MLRPALFLKKRKPFQESLSATPKNLKMIVKVLVKKWRWTSAKVMNK